MNVCRIITRLPVVTDRGAEKIMRGGSSFVQGRFADAQIELERAYAQIEGNGQENMALCCDFLAWRLALAKEMKPHCSLERRRTELLRHHNAAWLNMEWHQCLLLCAVG